MLGTLNIKYVHQVFLFGFIHFKNSGNNLLLDFTNIEVL